MTIFCRMGWRRRSSVFEPWIWGLISTLRKIPHQPTMRSFGHCVNGGLVWNPHLFISSLDDHGSNVWNLTRQPTLPNHLRGNQNLLKLYWLTGLITSRRTLLSKQHNPFLALFENTSRDFFTVNNQHHCLTTCFYKYEYLPNKMSNNQCKTINRLAQQLNLPLTK